MGAVSPHCQCLSHSQGTMATTELSPPVFGRSHISSQRGNQEVFQEEHWQLVRLGVRGSAGPWKALSLSERTRPSQPVWPNPYEVHEAFQDTVVLQNGSRFSVHRWLLREWLGGVRLFLGSSNLRDLETPTGVGEQDHFGATTVVLTLFRKDSEAVTYSGLFNFFFFFFLRRQVPQKESSPFYGNTTLGPSSLRAHSCGVALSCHFHSGARAVCGITAL